MRSSIRNLIRNDCRTVDPYRGIQSVKKYLSAGEAIVVMENEQCLGLLNASDVITKPHNLIIDCLQVKPTVKMEDTVAEVLEKMNAANAEALPVTDVNAFKGVVYKKDIIQHLRATLDEQQSLTYSVVHDLKSPIANIMQVANVLRASLVKGENLELLSFAERSCTYAIHLIEDLLLIGQLENGQTNRSLLLIADTDVFLNECIDICRTQAITKAITVSLSVKEVSPFYTDSVSMQRAIVNILTNAIKFTKPNGNVHITAESKEDLVCISIKDNGIGIPGKMIPHLFDKFTSAKRPGTNGETSTGLGMYITKRIIEMLHGRIWVESEENTGTIFCIELNNTLQPAM